MFWAKLILAIAPYVIGGWYALYERPNDKQSIAALSQALDASNQTIAAYQRSEVAAADNAILKSRQERTERDRLEAIQGAIHEANHPCFDSTVAGLLRPIEAEAEPGADGVHSAESE